MITITLRRLWPLILIGVVAVTACRNQTPSLPGVGEEAVLTCSEECAARGQCGTLSSGQPVVLANEAGPSVKYQDRFFTDGTLVTLIEVNEREVVAARNGVALTDSTAPFLHNFYRAQDGAGKTAWVSSWCIARPEN